jgi:hypothetical protein
VKRVQLLGQPLGQKAMREKILKCFSKLNCEMAEGVSVFHAKFRFSSSTIEIALHCTHVPTLNPLSKLCVTGLECGRRATDHALQYSRAKPLRRNANQDVCRALCRKVRYSIKSIT